MVYTISLLVALFLAQTAEPSKDMEQLRRQAAEGAAKHRQEAVRLNELAGHIKTESDAENLIDSIAKLFADELPPPWARREARLRMVSAEYAAVTNSARLIPEERLATIWNEYARAIGADNEMIVNTAEIHSLRDLEYASADFMWSQDWGQSIWTMPSVFTLGPDGKVTDRCRPLEAMRVFYDLDHQYWSLRAVRKALKEGKSFYDEMKREKERLRTATRFEARAELMSESNPVRTTEYSYINQYGNVAMYSLLKRLVDEFLPE